MSSHVTSGARPATTDMAARGSSRRGAASLVSLLTVVTLFDAAATFQRKVRKMESTKEKGESAKTRGQTSRLVLGSFCYV